LAFSVTEEEIRALFEPFGTVAQVSCQHSDDEPLCIKFLRGPGC
jgi:hypothetical protein